MLGVLLAAVALAQLSPDAFIPYEIRRGDTLTVYIQSHPELSVVVPVRPDGLISIPLVEDMPAAGKTLAQLSRDLEKALAKHVDDPVVEVAMYRQLASQARTRRPWRGDDCSCASVRFRPVIIALTRFSRCTQLANNTPPT